MNRENTVQDTTAEFGIMVPNQTWLKKDLPYIIPVTVMSALRVPEAMGVGPSFRDRVPEPFDAIDHIGNTAITFVIMDRIATGFMGKDLEALTETEFKTRRRLLAGTLGVLTVAANLVAEKVGYGSFSTPDYLDFIYGCAGGALAYKTRRGNYIPPEDVSRLLDSPDNSEKSVQIIEACLEKRQTTIHDHENDKTSGSSEILQTTPKTETLNRKSNNKNRKTIQKKSRQKNRKKK